MISPYIRKLNGKKINTTILYACQLMKRHGFITNRKVEIILYKVCSLSRQNVKVILITSANQLHVCKAVCIRGIVDLT